MLKKLFHGGQPSNNASSSASLTETRVSGLEKDEWDERTGYTQSVTQLDQFEARLRATLRTLTLHCQAITAAFSEQLHALLSGSVNMPSSASTSSTTKRPNDEALGLVNMFRVSAIAPLQSLLILVPQLRVRCEHRRSAMQLMLRYQRKVQGIERASKTKSESTRLQRNRAKLQAATARFRDLDNHVQQEIRIILSNDVAAFVERPTRELLLRAQLLAGQFAIESASPFIAAAVPQSTSHKTERYDQVQEGGTAFSNTQDPQQQVLTPQRRMAMTVLPLANENNNSGSSHCFVRQSILAPPTQPQLSVGDADTRKHLRHPSTTASEDDQSAEGDDSESTGVNASGYETVAAEIHEDYGIGKLKKHVHGTRRWDIHQLIKDNMSTGLDLVECVRLPDGFARDEWIAVHVVDFFNEINLLYGTISEFCTAEVCPRMSAGPCYAYTWTDAAAGVSASATHLPAAQYVARLMDWIEHQISDPRVFPSNAASYQPDFEVQVARVILKRLFRVYAHMYHSHLDHFAALSADAHLGFCFKRFVFFVTRFELVDQKELHALRKFVQSVLATPEATLLPVNNDDDAPETY